MACLVDSSVWVALFLDSDTQHTKARRLFRNLDSMLSVPYCVVVETATVLAYKHSKKQANNFLAYITDNRDIVLTEDTVIAEMNFYRSLTQKISFTDATLLYLSKTHKIPLVTLDKQLAQLAKKHHDTKSYLYHPSADELHAPARQSAQKNQRRAAP